MRLKAASYFFLLYPINLTNREILQLDSQRCLHSDQYEFIAAASFILFPPKSETQ